MERFCNLSVQKERIRFLQSRFSFWHLVFELLAVNVEEISVQNRGNAHQQICVDGIPLVYAIYILPVAAYFFCKPRDRSLLVLNLFLNHFSYMHTQCFLCIFLLLPIVWTMLPVCSFVHYLSCLFRQSARFIIFVPTDKDSEIKKYYQAPFLGKWNTWRWECLNGLFYETLGKN